MVNLEFSLEIKKIKIQSEILLIHDSLAASVTERG